MCRCANDRDGEQAWFLGVGEVKGDQIEVPLQIPTGTNFGDNFDPANVDRAPWGTLTLEFGDCQSGTARYASDIGDYGSGEVMVQRLTTLQGVPCSD